MNYAYARVSAKDRTYSGRLPRLVSSALKKAAFSPRRKAAQVSAASTDTEGFALQRAPLGNGAELRYASRERAPRA